MVQNVRPDNRPTNRAGPSKSSSLYEQDFALWTTQQAQTLRGMAGKLTNGMDVENLALEIEDLGKRDFRSLQSHCSTAIEHMIKIAWSTRDEPRAGWLATVRRSRDEIRLLLEDSPSLASRLEEKWGEVFTRGFSAAYEAFLMAKELPEDQSRVPPLKMDEFLDKDFHPGVWIIETRKGLGLDPLPNTGV